MTTYTQFHGEIPINYIGKELRMIAARGKSFKVLTGYGSGTGKCKSKEAAIKSLGKMKRDGLIQDFIPGEKITELIPDCTNYFLIVKQKYWSILSKDVDHGNDGIIFVFC